jgi:hypothetical protein
MSHTYGEKGEFWKNKVQEGLPPQYTPGRDDILCANQVKVHSAGFREAGLVETIFGYSVRLRSGLCGNQVLFGGRSQGRYVSYEEALEWGKSWVDDSPDFRVLNYGEKCPGCTLDYHKNEAVRS